MKRTLEILLVGVLAAGMLTGCPKKEEAEEPKAEETTQEEETKEDAAKAEEEPAPDAAAAAAEVDETMYVKAAYEVSCVKSKIEDPEKQKTILAEVYARYGFEDQDAFSKVEEQMKDKETVRIAVQEKMKDCTPEAAEGFAQAGAAAAEEGKEQAQGDKPQAAKKPAKAWKAGAFSANNVGGGGLENAQVQVRINDDGKVLGTFKGKREGKGFAIPLRGEVNDKGAISAKGSKGKNQVRVTGRYKDGQVAGNIQGSIHEKSLRTNFTAK